MLTPSIMALSRVIGGGRGALLWRAPKSQALFKDTHDIRHQVIQSVRVEMLGNVSITNMVTFLLLHFELPGIFE